MEHKKDYKKISNKLPLIGVAFVLILIVGFVSSKEPELKYEMSSEQMHIELLKRTEILTPEEAVKILYSNTPGYRFIDLRTPQDFINGHIDGAINIPLQNILSDEYNDFWADRSKINIIYANTHDQACGPWMLLKQLGHNNNRIMLGGYSFFRENVKDDFAIRSKNYHDEKAKYDFAKIVKETAGSGVSTAKPSQTKKAPPVRRKKKLAAEGGCS